MITVLFADLVGSTVLAERLDVEEVKLVVGDAVVRMIAEVERFGGYVKDVAGDGVLAYQATALRLAGVRQVVRVLRRPHTDRETRQRLNAWVR